jgi:hypothetical protein
MCNAVVEKMDNLNWSNQRSRSIGTRRARRGDKSSGSRRTTEGSEIQVYHRRSVQEREMAAEITRARMEEEALQGLNQLGEGVVYATVMGLPVPTAPPRPGIPVMHELPRRVNGLHPRITDNQAMQEGRYTQATELLPQMVPPHIEKEITASAILCRIKRGIKQWIHRVVNGKEKKAY